jgi:hypothetical protein
MNKRILLVGLLAVTLVLASVGCSGEIIIRTIAFTETQTIVHTQTVTVYTCDDSGLNGDTGATLPLLNIISVTSPVNAGSDATLVAQTTPGAFCTITVYYKSGASTAQGLGLKTADSTGRVSWTWRVGTNTTPGDWLIVVKATYGGETVSEEIYFTVI